MLTPAKNNVLPIAYNGTDTFNDCWARVCKLRESHTAIIDPHTNTTLTYADLNNRIQQLAHAFYHQLGWRSGQCVGILMHNSWAFIAAFMACQHLGVVVAPLSWRLTTNELAPITQDAGMIGLITEENCLEGWAPPSPCPLKTLVFTNTTVTEFSSTIQTVTLASLLAPYDDSAPPLSKREATELAALVYTSGTTGQPKGVMLSQRNILSDVWANQQVIEAVPDDVFITTSPLFHVFGFTNVMLSSLLAGATLLVLPKFSPSEVLSAIGQYHVTFMAAVPTMYQMMLTHLPDNQYDLSSLRVCHSGAAPMHKTVFEAIETQFGAPVQEGYGQSEGSSILTSNPLHETRKPGSIGLPLNGLSIDIVDDTDTPLPPNEVGELRMSGPTVMLGYWQQPEKTAQTVRDGWLYTRDMGYKDEDGYIFLVDRQDDMMNVGGSKVFPREIEEVIYRFPGIRRCAVKAEPSDLYGQIPAAYIVLDETAVSDGKSCQTFIDSLWAHCHDHLAGYKLPYVFYRMSDLPTGATGKLLRHQLRSSDAQETLYPVKSS